MLDEIHFKFREEVYLLKHRNVSSNNASNIRIEGNLMETNPESTENVENVE
jgi:hypothetical protein